MSTHFVNNEGQKIFDLGLLAEQRRRYSAFIINTVAAAAAASSAACVQQCGGCCTLELLLPVARKHKAALLWACLLWKGDVYNTRAGNLRMTYFSLVFSLSFLFGFHFILIYFLGYFISSPEKE